MLSPFLTCSVISLIGHHFSKAFKGSSLIRSTHWYLLQTLIQYWKYGQKPHHLPYSQCYGINSINKCFLHTGTSCHPTLSNTFMLWSAPCLCLQLCFLSYPFHSDLIKCTFLYILTTVFIHDVQATLNQHTLILCVSSFWVILTGNWCIHILTCKSSASSGKMFWSWKTWTLGPGWWHGADGHMQNEHERRKQKKNPGHFLQKMDAFFMSQKEDVSGIKMRYGHPKCWALCPH